MDIPIPTLPILPHPGLIFYRWLPEENEALIFEEGDFGIRLWFDTTCIDDGFKPFPANDLAKWSNVTVTKVLVDVVARDIADDLVEFIFATANKSDLSKPKQHVEYQNLNAKVIGTAIEYVNRLISYFRNEKGQYWLEYYRYLYNHHVIDARNKMPFHIEFNARVKLNYNGSEWAKWNAPYIGALTISGESFSRYMKPEEWPQVFDFVSSSRNPRAILEILTNAEYLAHTGSGRSAIVEAVSALEFAVNKFSQSPKWNELVNSERVRRIDARGLATQVKHSGFSMTLRYLIPLLLDEAVLPSELLSKCHEAIDKRGTVVHGLQRKSLDRKDLLPMIHAIRQTCTILEKFTGEEPNLTE
jgi:hypothetical protein